MILGIDHILIAVDDLEIATETYEALGFQVVPGGKHPNMGTHNALVPLSDGTYFELIGVWDKALAEQGYPFILDALSHQNRLARFVLESDNIDADVAAIKARGFDIADPTAGERERPDGQKVAWRSALPADWNYPFILQDVTPHNVRVSAPRTGIGRFLQIGDVFVGVRDVAAATIEYQKLLGMDGDEGWFDLPRGAIILQDVDEPVLLQVVLPTETPNEIISVWQNGGVPYDEHLVGGVGITLEPENTLGAPIAITGTVS